MSTLAQLITARDTAVTDYASKLTDFHDAFVELAALDIALGSPAIAHGPQRPGFGDYPDPITFRHVIAAPDFGGRFSDDVNDRVKEIVEAYPTSD